MLKTISIIALMSLGGFACSESNLPKYEALGPLRVLAIIASAPEVNLPAPPTVPAATQNFTVEVWVSDLDGAGRPLSWTLRGCADTGIAFGATPNCDNALDVQTYASPGAWPGAVASATNAWTNRLASWTIAVPTDVFVARSAFTLGAIDQYNGVNYLLEFTISAANGDSVRAIKRLIFSTRTPSNQNPLLSGILSNGAPLATSANLDAPVVNSLPTSRVTLAPQITSQGSAESDYSVQRSDGSFTTASEQLLITWFISDGSLDQARTSFDFPSLDWTPPASSPVGRNAALITVLRDGRGGVAVQAATF